MTVEPPSSGAARSSRWLLAAGSAFVRARVRRLVPNPPQRLSSDALAMCKCSNPGNFNARAPAWTASRISWWNAPACRTGNPQYKITKPCAGGSKAKLPTAKRPLVPWGHFWKTNTDKSVFLQRSEYSKKVRRIAYHTSIVLLAWKSADVAVPPRDFVLKCNKWSKR